MRSCSQCKLILNDAKFYITDNRCKDCLAKKARKYRATKAGRDSLFKTRLKARGLTLDQWNTMLANQEGRCKLCPNTKGDRRSNLHIDHCHKTGRIRGLLCAPCNLALGHYEKVLGYPKKLIEIWKEYLQGK